jgi:ArsR family transcriptional regulator
MKSRHPEKMVDIFRLSCIHEDVVRDVARKLPKIQRIQDLSEMYKLFANSTRLHILWALSESEMCVCDICALLQMKQPTVSHQLKYLYRFRLVKTRREGKVIYYSLDDDHIRTILDIGMIHISENTQCKGLQYESDDH